MSKNTVNGLLSLVIALIFLYLLQATSMSSTPLVHASARTQTEENSAYPMPPEAQQADIAPALAEAVIRSAYPAPLNRPETINSLSLAESSDATAFEPPSITDPQQRTVVTGMIPTNKPLEVDASEIPVVVPLVEGDGIGWTELLFDKPLSTTSSKCSYVTYKDIDVNGDGEGDSFNRYWGRVTPPFSNVSDALWPAGGGSDALNPTRSYPKNLDTTWWCNLDLSSPRVDSLYLRMSMNIDLGDNDYAELIVAVRKPSGDGYNTIYTSTITSESSIKDTWQEKEFGPVSLREQVDISRVLIGLRFHSDDQNDPGRRGVWVDWLQVKGYRENLTCGRKNADADFELFKGLNISSLDPTVNQYIPEQAGSLLIRERDIHNPLDSIENTNTNWVRFPFDLPLRENTNLTNLKMLERYDFMVDSLCERGISVLGILGADALRVGFIPNKAEYRTTFANEAGRLAQHFGNRINYWEVWNEPDLNPNVNGEGAFLSPDQFADLLTETYLQIRSTNPQAKIVSGGLYNARVEGQAYFDDFYFSLVENGLIAFDHFGIHPYTSGRFNISGNPSGTGVDPTQYMYAEPSIQHNTILDPFLETMFNFGLTPQDRKKTIWVTEIGWNEDTFEETDNDNLKDIRLSCRQYEAVTIQEQADYLHTMFDILRNDVSLWNSSDPAVERIFWYQYMDHAQANTNGDTCKNEPYENIYLWNYGLRTNKGSLGKSKLTHCAFSLYPTDCNLIVPYVYLPITSSDSSLSGLDVEVAETDDQFGTFYVDPIPKTSGNIDITTSVKEGEGRRNSSFEYIEIRNNDIHPIAMNGWTLTNKQGEVYTFPQFIMQPGRVCRIYTNQYYAEWCGFNWERSNLRPSGRTNRATGSVALRNKQGSLVDQCRYQNYQNTNGGTHCSESISQ